MRDGIPGRRGGAWLLRLFILISGGLLLFSGSITSDAVRESLTVCARVIVPSLFPYMVLSCLFVSIGASEVLGRLTRPLSRFLRLPVCGSTPIVLGALCGFPVGAKATCDLYREGRLSKTEAERLIGVANNTGPAFLLEIVGVYFWNSRAFGLVLYIAQLLAALLVGRLFAPRRHEVTKDRGEAPFPRRSLLAQLADAVRDSAAAVLAVCAFVAFFAVVSRIAQYLLAEIRGEGIFVYLAGLLEFTAGVSASSALGGMLGAFLTGFSVGWSGLSVFAQASVFAAPCGLSLRIAALSKLLQGIAVGSIAALYVRFFYEGNALSCVLSAGQLPPYALEAEILSLILFCFLPFSPRRKERS